MTNDHSKKMSAPCWIFATKHTHRNARSCTAARMLCGAMFVAENVLFYAMLCVRVRCTAECGYAEYGHVRAMHMPVAGYQGGGFCSANSSKD